jgi:predicted nucleic acid-binding protein
MPTDTGADEPPAVLLDTSTAVAFIVEDHEAHATAVAAVEGRRLGLAGHAWFETYSVLTRLPAGLRRSPADALRLLMNNFPATRFLSETETIALASELGRLGVAGGSVYDALVGAVARQHRQPLVTRDVRARPLYEALGVEIEVIA